MKQYVKRGHVVIERIWPAIDGGRYRAKAITGDVFTVWADIYRDGTDMLQAVVRYRGPNDRRWSESEMAMVDVDRWSGSFVPTDIGRYRYVIEAWTDRFGTWRRDLIKRVGAGQDVDLELEEGALLIEARLGTVKGKNRAQLAAAVDAIRGRAGDGGADDPRIGAALDESLLAVMRSHPDRSGSQASEPVLEVTVDRERARFGSWYEFFVRSTGPTGRHGTFKTAAAELERIAAMGFDIVYLPPIHPIGVTNRKGKNNSLTPSDDDVGVPWAIGSADGGHTAVSPQLGTIADFDDFVGVAERLGLEVCLDYAIQCSPDHPWVKEHPEWFHHRPDGTIKYAENPPKKYQDIYPINFDTDTRESLWLELKGIFDFWIEHGIKIFRVDNPHTKALPFWEWVVDELKTEHPDLILLSEAFTRPRVMQGLAKLGFTQSYTYFTWRNTKWELTDYLTELTTTEMADYLRPNFFANTPDILHEFLQTGGRSAFKIRLVLAATLSPTYGIYSGFELCENVPLHEGSEEYLNSEKYELKHRKFDIEGNIAPYITRVNEIRHKNPALAQFRNLHFHNTDKDNVMAYSKSSTGNAILTVVSLNPWHWEEATVTLDLEALGITDLARPFEVHDLLGDTTYLWHGPFNYVRLDPESPAHIFEVRA